MSGRYAKIWIDSVQSTSKTAGLIRVSSGGSDVYDRLTGLGYSVTRYDAGAMSEATANGHDVVYMSEAIWSGGETDTIADSTTGIVTAEYGVFDDYYISNSGSNTTGSQIVIEDSSHQLAAGLSGTVTVTSGSLSITHAHTNLASGGHVVASYNDDNSKPTIFAFETGSASQP